MKRVYFLIIFCIVSSCVFAQAFLRPHEWKKFRREIFVTLGSANFLGDLGGRDRKGTDYSPADLDFSQTRSAFGFGATYRLHKNINVASKFNYLVVKGDDAKTNDIYRRPRNLNFKSNIFELSVRGEAGIQRIKRGGGHYGVQRNTQKFKNMSHNLYGFLGIGVFYFNPKGRIPGTNEYVALRPLHTEGQGLEGGPKQYKRISLSIPIGGYYKLTVSKIWSIGIEFCYRKTFTDYIDDVGGVYYDPAALAANYGPLSAKMADPYLGIPTDHANVDGVAAQRGDKQKDTFVSLELRGSYTFKQQRKSARLRSKF